MANDTINSISPEEAVARQKEFAKLKGKNLLSTTTLERDGGGRITLRAQNEIAAKFATGEYTAKDLAKEYKTTVATINKTIKKRAAIAEGKPGKDHHTTVEDAALFNETVAATPIDTEQGKTPLGDSIAADKKAALKTGQGHIGIDRPNQAFSRNDTEHYMNVTRRDIYNRFVAIENMATRVFVEAAKNGSLLAMTDTIKSLRGLQLLFRENLDARIRILGYDGVINYETQADMTVLTINKMTPEELEEVRVRANSNEDDEAGNEDYEFAEEEETDEFADEE